MLVQIFTTENTENTEEKKRFKKMITNPSALPLRALRVLRG